MTNTQSPLICNKPPLTNPIMARKKPAVSYNKSLFALLTTAILTSSTPSIADESLFGHVSGAETLPKGANIISQTVTLRTNKGAGKYDAVDYKTEFERGLTNRLTGAIYLMGMTLNTSGIVVDGYLPKDKTIDFRITGIEGSLKYNFLSPAKDDFGLAGEISVKQLWVDPHSGQDKDTTSAEFKLMFQKYLSEGQIILVGNLGLEATQATRKAIAVLPAGFDWPTDPEMEIELNAGAGASYRIIPKLFIGVETFYAEEHETEVGRERWSLQAGPNVHYAGQTWWVTLAWLRQLKGGGETFAEQKYKNLHLIEKTRDEVILKTGFSF